MADIQWRQPAFNPVRFNPNAGLAVASRSFEGINDAVRERKHLESLAKARADALDLATRKQDYAEGATQRAIDLEDRALAKSAEQGKILSGIVDDPSMSRRDTIFGDTGRLAESPEFRELSGLQVGGVGPMQPDKAGATYAAQDAWAERNKAALQLPPAEMEKKIFTDLINSGKFSREDAKLLASEETAKAHPRLSEAMAKTTLQALKPVGKGNTLNVGGGGKILSGSGSYKGEFDVGSPTLRGEASDRIADVYNLPDQTGYTERVMRFVGFDSEPSRSEVDQAFGYLAQKGGGVSATAAQSAVTQAFDVSGDLKPSMDWNTKVGKANLLKAANEAQENELRKFNTKTGTSGNAAGALYAELASQNNWKNTVSDVLGRVTPTNVSNEDLTNAFLGSITPPTQPTIAPAATRNPASGAKTKGDTNDNTQPSSSILPTPTVGGDTLPPPDEQVGLPADAQGDISYSPYEAVPEAENFATGIVDSLAKSAGNFKKDRAAKADAQLNRITALINKTGGKGMDISGEDIRMALNSKNLKPADEKVLKQLLNFGHLGTKR